MPHAPTDLTREDGEIVELFFSSKRTELRNAVREITDIIDNLDSIDHVKAIREKKSNPVIKTDRSDRIYMKWEGGRARVNLRMAKGEVKDAIIEYFMSEQTEEQQDNFPWDREEMKERVREIKEERRESSRESSETRERARSESNHRDEYQQEPRGGERTGQRSRAKIEGNRTSFIPPYDKNGVNYNWAGEGSKDHLDCRDCVHYIEGGGCHMVQGEIDPEGYCEDLYADVGLFARMYEGEFEINLAMWGEMFEDRFGRVSFEQIGQRVKEAIRKKL